MAKKMKAAAITSEEKVEIIEVKKPIPKEGEVLVNIKACALCTFEQRTYLGVIKMPLPFIGGHEISGIIESVGPGVDEKEFPVGEKVAVRGFNSCGRCYYCRLGSENLCTNMSNSNKYHDEEVNGIGGLAQYIAIDQNCIYKLPKNLPFEYGAIAEPLACVVNSMKQGEVDLGNDVVVIGAGIMGILHVMLSKLRGARVIVSEPDAARRAKAKEAGADIVFDPVEENFVEKVKSLTEGRGADVIFNTTAIAKLAEEAIQGVRNNGRVVMYSSIHPDEPISVSPNWIHKSQVKITGAVNPTVESFQTSVILLSKGLIKPKNLISAKFSLDNIQKAFEEAIRPDTYRIIVTND